MMADAWWLNEVWRGGEWDYKKYGLQYHDFGNFNFGATGTALGLSSGALLRGAGMAKHLWTKANRSQMQGSLLGGVYPYFNTMDDATMIQAGIDYAAAGCDHP